MGELHWRSYKKSFRQAVMRERLLAWLTLKFWISFRYAEKEFLGVRRDQVDHFVAIAGLANRPRNIRIHLAISRVRVYPLGFNSSGNFCDGAICSCGRGGRRGGLAGGGGGWIGRGEEWMTAAEAVPVSRRRWFGVCNCVCRLRECRSSVHDGALYRCDLGGPLFYLFVARLL